MAAEDLETFMETNDYTYKSNLKTIILEKSYRALNPTVIIDFSTTPKLYPPNDVSLLCYGRPILVKEKIQQLVTSITSLGVNLIVIFKGNPRRPLQTWFKEQCAEKRKEKIFLEQIKTNRVGQEFLTEDRINCLRDCVKNTVKSLSNVKVLTSLKNAHEEVIEHARKCDCIAVIGQDSNYIIYNEIPVYISMKKFSIDTLDCTVYDTDKLLKFLDLRANQLPLFATLCGNDIIDQYRLHLFHKDIYDPDINIFVKIAKLVKPIKNPYKELSTIVKLIDSTCVNADLVRKSLDMYMKNKGTDGSNRKFLDEKKARCDLHNVLYELIKTREIRLYSRLENLEDPQTVPAWKMFKCIREKIYGVVFGGYGTVQEYYLDVKDQNLILKFWRLKFCMPDCKHPGMEKLWATSSTTDVKWNLFCKTMSRDIGPSTLKKVPPKLRLVLVTLHYLAHEMPQTTKYSLFNEKYEVKAFLITAIRTYTNLKTDVKVDVPDYRALLLSSIFFECYDLIIMLNQSCGFIVSNEESCCCNFFDGVTFQYIYKKLQEGGNEEEFLENNTVLEVTFNSLLDIIYNKIE